ncbi:MAG: ABC transporter ATP-binding protein [Desulfomonile sp.]|nr:ABC transporter ATP-binding protein [Desulfomonile sp.]
MNSDGALDGPILEIKDLSMRFRIEHPTTLKEQVMNVLKRRRYANPNDNNTSFWALRDVCFSLEEGDRLGVIGVNGSGKSTLLNLICGIYKPSAGTIIRRGAIFPVLQMGLGFDSEATAEENVYLTASFYGFHKHEVTSLVDEIFEFSELTAFRDQPLKIFSTGMQARLGFTICTSMTPDILVLDEVFAPGDAHWVQKALKRLHEMMDSARLLIMATHNMGHVKNYCNKCLWLHAGQIKAFGGVEVADQYLKRYSSCQKF